jgi:hypothetical protein
MQTLQVAKSECAFMSLPFKTQLILFHVKPFLNVCIFCFFVSQFLGLENRAVLLVQHQPTFEIEDQISKNEKCVKLYLLIVL